MTDELIDEMLQRTRLAPHAGVARAIVRSYLPDKPELSERVKLLAMMAATIAAPMTVLRDYTEEQVKTFPANACIWAATILEEFERRGTE